MASTGILTAGVLVRTSTSAQQQQQRGQTKASDNNSIFQIEADLMDRIAQKPYLQAFTSNDEQPRGVPHRLRVLAIDVPEMRVAFDGECRINLSKIYADDIAPAKDLKSTLISPATAGSSDGKTSTDTKQQIAFRVAQKSFAKSLIKCRKQKKIGVELLEASIADLNPYNMRKTHQFGSLINYDPGKYTSRPLNQKDKPPGGGKNADNKAENTDGVGTNSRKDPAEESVLATEEDEIDAPWNQYAWIEEMQIRINGKVPFGSTLNPASSLTRILYGNVFKTTVPSNRAIWEWFLPPLLHRDPAGKEGNRRNWASHKPHAVIADGAALQRVPGSMRYLQNTCQEANVPLFIVNDPRVWGGNTHQDLNDALRDMRKTIKYNIVQQSMQGSAFSRGRLLGQLETEAKWQAKDMGRRTREAVKDANRRLQEERVNDWSKLTANELQERLVTHKAIAVVKSTNGDLISQCTDGLVELAQRLVSNPSDEETVSDDEVAVAASNEGTLSDTSVAI